MSEFIKVKTEYTSPPSPIEDPIFVLDELGIDTNLRIYKDKGGIIIKRTVPELVAQLFMNIIINEELILSDIIGKVGIISPTLDRNESINNAFSIPRNGIDQDPLRGNLENVLYINNIEKWKEVAVHYSLFINHINKHILSESSVPL